MNKHLSQFFFLFFTAGSITAQTFTFVVADTITFGSPGSVIFCKDSIKNNSSAGYYVDVVRVVNDTAPNWETAFCLDQCYPSSTDSARFYLPADSSQSFILDFFTDTIPDTSRVMMKFKNVSNPSNTFYQWFYGITIPGLGINNNAGSKNVKVQLSPSPVIAGSAFRFSITDMQNESNDYILIIHGIYGNAAARIDHLKPGNNFLSLNFSEGMYIYTLLLNNAPVNTGKFLMVK